MIHYYPSLSAAVAAVNGGAAGATTADDSTLVEVVTSSKERPKVRLLGDVAENTAVTVGADMELMLNGHTLRFTEIGAYLSFGSETDAVIYGAGGTITKTLEHTGTDSSMLISTEGNSLRIRGGTYTNACATGGTALTIRATAACQLLEVEDCTINAENSNNIAYAFQTQAKDAFVRNCNIKADASHTAYGILSAGGCKVWDSNIDAHNTGENTAVGVRVITGSIVLKGCKLHVAADTNWAFGVEVEGGAVTVESCTLRADAFDNYAIGIRINAGTASVTKSKIVATVHGGDNSSSTGISVASNTSLNAKDTDILADSTPICGNPGNNTYGIANYGTAYLENVRVNGNHSAVQNGTNAKLYVSGGVYTGYSHGGFYFAHGAGGEAFVNDAILRGGHYEGVYDYTDVPKNIKYAAAYIGGGPGENNWNITAYLDGCVFDASDCHRAMVLRGSHSEQNNTINISNCVVGLGTLDEGTIRIDNATLRLNVGAGNNVIPAMFKNYFLYPNESGGHDQTAADYEQTGVVQYTKASYRKFP